jgi:hypothetical protein
MTRKQASQPRVDPRPPQRAGAPAGDRRYSIQVRPAFVRVTRPAPIVAA